MSKTAAPLHLMNWIAQHRERMKPPVGNEYLYRGEDFFVMVVAGPNARNDFHITDSEEFFLQLKGDVIVRTRENGVIRDNIIREGETFFIPPRVPHSPQRGPGTLGLVVERNRPAGETEQVVWYCEKCGELVHNFEFDCKDIVSHFAEAMEQFWRDDARRVCAKCGTRVEKPGPRTQNP